MARKSTHTFVQSKMNKDLDARLLEAGQYRDAQNVAVSRSDSADVGALENILGNILLKIFPVRGVNLAEAIGWCFNEDKDEIYVFITDYKGSNKAPITSYHSIIQYNVKDDSTKLLVTGSFLNFSIDKRINDAEMIEDLLFWTDDRNQPRKINVTLANPNDINVPTYYSSEDTISVAKYYPYNSMKLTKEVEIEAIYVDSQEVPAGSGLIYAPYQASLYNYFVLPDNPSQEIIDLLFMNIGLSGYIEAGQGIAAPTLIGDYTFKLAFFQQDGWRPAGAVAGNTRLPGNYAGKYMLFVDRDFGNGNVIAQTSWTAGAGSIEKIKIKFKVPQAIDVSSPWRKDDQIKISVKNSALSNVTYAQASDNNPTTGERPKVQAHNLYMFGTRSTGMDYGVNAPVAYNPGEPSYNPQSDFVNGPVFKIDNLFTRNSGDAAHGYIRVTNPKIPPEIICVITTCSTTYNPSLNQYEFRFLCAQLTGVEGASQLSFIDITNVYGITTSDILSLHWPNKHYDAEFAGDPIFTQDKFIRFSYRFRYDDGEYSIIAPFTQSVFIPKQDGYFLKNVNKTPLDATRQELVPQIQLAGQNTIVEWFENKVTQAQLTIPIEYQQNEIVEKLHVTEIDILYKESSQMAVKVLKTIELADVSLNSDKFFNYTYKSEEPIKVLDSAEIGRVYDNVPVKAKTQAITGNRVVYANFLDKHTSPLELPFNVGVSAKYDANFKDTSDAYYCYPNHTLKQNRTYQVGIILSDRYGRSSDVVLAPEDVGSFVKNIKTQEGDWSNSPINFNNSTVYNPYFDSVFSLYTPQNTELTNPTRPAAMVDTPSPKAGIINWQGDSLKLGFNISRPIVPSELYAVPGSLDRPGYPGVYVDVITNPVIEINKSEVYSGVFAPIQDDGYTLYQVEWGPAVGSGFLGDVGDYFTYDYTDLNGSYVGEAIIMDIERNINGITGAYRSIIATKDSFPVDDPLTPTMNAVVYNQQKTLGWYSYRIVVKQKEQEYYNVYLPSLLKGNPIPKPFKLFLKQPAQATTKILEVDDSSHPTPQTFPILEGMALKLNTKKVFVSNILNDTQFEITEAVANTEINAAAGTPAVFTEYEFTSTSNGSTLNTTTLLTDNANKVPPSLIETTPIQAQYGTSETRLIPRVALPGNKVNASFGNVSYQYDYNNVPPSPYGSWTFPVYPNRGQSLKVRSLGNFENLFIDGKYNGLWQADTNPPSGVIENVFNIGREVETAKPQNEEMYQEAVFETTPTVSNLEIFYESSTSGLVEDLNRASTFNRTLEIDFYNSFWEKRIKIAQPENTTKGINGLIYDVPSDPGLGTRGVGSSPAIGVFPLSSCYAPPVTTDGRLFQSWSGTTETGVLIEDDASLADYNFYLEESRLRGGFNNVATSLGARAFLDQDDPTQQNRFNALIYSGVYNSRTGVNRTNEFPTGQVLTRAANPENGSIQKIYSEEGNLLVLQENKCNRALIDKDTIYTTEGGTQTQAAGTVIGQITPYAGLYGISKNPESFGIYGFRKYFADVNRGCMLRLSHDGVTEISEYGMRDWFRDNLATINQDQTNEFIIECIASGKDASSTGQTWYEVIQVQSPDLNNNLLIGSEAQVKDPSTSEYVFAGIVIAVDSVVPAGTDPKVYLDSYAPFYGLSTDNQEIRFIQRSRSYIIGGWDIYNKQYVCSLQYNLSSKLKFKEGVEIGGKDFTYYTTSFDEPTKGWPSFYNYRPGLIGSMKNKYFTVNNSSMYTGNLGGDFGLYEQFAQNQPNNRGYFYGNHYQSSVTIIANQGPSVQKTFLTVDYEGNNGWEATLIFSDETGFDLPDGFYTDDAALILSYTDAAYVDPASGYTLRAGFDRKDNRYVANLVNSTPPMPGEIIFGDKMTGIKGYYSEAKFTTDLNTDLGGMKELYQVGMSYNISAT